MPKAFRIASALLAALMIWSAGCRRGPKVESWIVDVDSLVNASGRSIGYPAADGFVCMSPNDTRRLLRACNEKRGTDLNGVCIISRPQHADCADGIAKPLKDLVNWWCLDAPDFEELLSWCKRGGKAR